MIKAEEKSSYKWVIVIASFFVMVMVNGIIYNVFAVFTIPVTNDLGINRQSFSLAQTLVFIATIFINPFISNLIDKFGLIRLLRVFSVVTPAIYFGFSAASEMWQFYLIALLIGASHCFISLVPLSILLNSWFSKNIGLALGITYMGSGIGGMILNPVANLIIENYGWRTAFTFLGIAMFIVIVPICFFILRDPAQADRGASANSFDAETPDIDLTTAEPEYAANAPESSTDSRPPFLRDKRFWILALIFALNGIAGFTMINFIVPHFCDLGFSSYYAANIMSMSMGLLAVGKVVLGAIYDRTNIRFATLLAIFASIIGLAAMYFAQFSWAIAALAFGTFLGSPAGTVSQPLITRKMFRADDFAKANSLFICFNNAGVALCPFFGSAVFDSTGSYRIAFAIMTVVMAVVYVLFHIILPKEQRANGELVA